MNYYIFDKCYLNLENFGFFSNRIELTEIMKEIKWDRYRFDPSIKVVYVYFFLQDRTPQSPQIEAKILF